MKQFINNKLKEIFADFKRDADQKGCLCELKGTNFQGGRIPDYKNAFVQRYYLLRFFPAYLAEYYLMYDKLFSIEFLSPPFNVLSIGAGCFVDYYGLHFAKEVRKDYSLIDYTGIDSIDWHYKGKIIKQDRARFLHYNISELYAFAKHLPDTKHNIIVFPKSIGEFTPVEFGCLKSLFKESNLEKSKMCLMSSLRSEDNCNDVDRRRIGELTNILIKYRGYRCQDDINKVYEMPQNQPNNPNNYIGKEVRGWDYDSTVCRNVRNTLAKCKKYQDNCVEYDSDCIQLNRNPILKTSYMKYQILRFER